MYNTKLQYQQHVTDSNGINYKILYDTAFHEETCDRVVYLLHTSIHNRDVRYRIYYGDVKTGKAWGDISTCYIGRSTGSIKIPLAIHNKRSMGGEALLDHCIVKIEYANKKNGGVLFDCTK